MFANPFLHSLLARGLWRAARQSSAAMPSRMKLCMKRTEKGSAGVDIPELERAIETEAPPTDEPAWETP